MQRTAINPENLQAHLESASNATAKGQAQYHTPAEWGQVLALPLPRFRPAIVDLTSGNGQLLAAVAGPSTTHQLGCDIEKFPATVQADVTKFYPVLREIKFKADLFALNPPWDLHWYRDALADLLDSDCAAVRHAFSAHDGRTAKDTIDSTIATMSMGLDLMSPCGEAFIVANEATLQRLLFAEGAPHQLLAAHVWAHLIIDGNICTKPDPKSEFKTGVIYFARGHTASCQFTREIKHDGFNTILGTARRHCQTLAEARLEYRQGAVIKPVAYTKATPELWTGAATEFAARQNVTRHHWNLWLDAGGLIRTNLSVFDHQSGRVDKGEAERLFALNGRRPMQLVVQRAHRKELERAAFGTTWRVQAELQAAVKAAVFEYESVRAPIVPLAKIQRLGYLDELDTIVCEKALRGFTEGQSYVIRTLTLQTRRAGEKMNLEGGVDAVEWSGSQLAIYLKDNEGVERLFMEAKLRDKKVWLSVNEENETAMDKIDFTLQQLAAHFIIPEVPDVATLFPELYQHNLQLLDEIERLVNA